MDIHYVYGFITSSDIIVKDDVLYVSCYYDTDKNLFDRLYSFMLSAYDTEIKKSSMFFNSYVIEIKSKVFIYEMLDKLECKSFINFEWGNSTYRKYINDNIQESVYFVFEDDIIDENNEIEWMFIRGMFDNTGYIDKTMGGVKFKAKFECIKSILKRIMPDIPFVDIGYNTLSFDENSGYEFLTRLYSESHCCNTDIVKTEKYKIFTTLRYVTTFKCIKNDSLAVIPSKVRMSDAGMDLTVIKLIKVVGDVYFYDTCISIVPSSGYYFKVYPRSSISKTGYMLANGVGVIDETYTGNVIIALRKMSPDVTDLELPCKIAQLIPERCIYSKMVETSSSDKILTSRGSGGFGSTG